ncbi:hypothetical protein GCM10009727_46200 [Actinomadura napierensis]|uniref:Uncharacterized protein n=1 Tax=Actinomadura napierensis TaxID=267854 RepID=A0ABN2ZPR6_9ACTN
MAQVWIAARVLAFLRSRSPGLAGALLGSVTVILRGKNARVRSAPMAAIAAGAGTLPVTAVPSGPAVFWNAWTTPGAARRALGARDRDQVRAARVSLKRWTRGLASSARQTR